MSTEFLLWMVNGLFALLFVVSGAFVKELWAQVKKAREECQALALELAKNYPTKNDLREVMQQILERLKNIDEKLDQKVDKE
jgi:galactokinase